MTVLFTNPAVEDLQTIREYLAQYSESLAKRTIERIIDKADLLRNGFPDIGQVEPLLEDHPLKPRYLLEGNYKIIYRYDPIAAYILMIFDVRQNPSRLTERFNNS